MGDTELIEDYSQRIRIMHYIAIGGVIIWPERRAGEKVEEEEKKDAC